MKKKIENLIWGIWIIFWFWRAFFLKSISLEIGEWNDWQKDHVIALVMMVTGIGMLYISNKNQKEGVK